MVSGFNTPANGPVTGSTVPTGDRRIVHEEERLGEPHYGMGPAHSHVAWGAVFAGSFLAIALLILSSVLAYACGVPGFRGDTYGFGSGLWAVVTSAIAFFCGGCLTTYMTPKSELRTGVAHGVMAWAFTIPVLALVFSGVLLGMRGYLGMDLGHMTGRPLVNQPNADLQTGAAWGSFICLLVGLICSALGGIVGIRGGDLADMPSLRRLTRTTSTTA